MRGMCSERGGQSGALRLIDWVDEVLSVMNGDLVSWRRLCRSPTAERSRCGSR